MSNLLITRSLILRSVLDLEESNIIMFLFSSPCYDNGGRKN